MCSVICGLQVWFSCWISLLPAEAVLVRNSLNWVTAVLAHSGTVAHFSVSENDLKPGEKTSRLVKLPPPPNTVR